MKKYIFLLAALVLCTALVSCKGNEPPVITEPVTTGILPDPVITTENDVDYDAPATTEPAPVTEPPVSTDAPVTDPVTDDTTEAAKPPHTPGRELGSGFVISDSGTKLNLLLNWTAADGEEEEVASLEQPRYAYHRDRDEEAERRRDDDLLASEPLG